MSLSGVNRWPLERAGAPVVGWILMLHRSFDPLLLLFYTFQHPWSWHSLKGRQNMRETISLSVFFPFHGTQETLFVSFSTAFGTLLVWILPSPLNGMYGSCDCATLCRLPFVDILFCDSKFSYKTIKYDFSILFLNCAMVLCWISLDKSCALWCFAFVQRKLKIKHHVVYCVWLVSSFLVFFPVLK